MVMMTKNLKILRTVSYSISYQSRLLLWTHSRAVVLKLYYFTRYAKGEARCVRRQAQRGATESGQRLLWSAVDL